MALSAIAVPFALAEGFKPLWQIQKNQFSLLSSAVQTIVIQNHKP